MSNGVSGFHRAAPESVVSVYPFLTLIALAFSFSLPATAMPIDVMLIGDSITSGAVSTEAGLDTGCPQSLCYADRLASILGDDYRIINAGVGGASTIDWASTAPGLPYIDVNGTPTALFEGLAAPNLPADIVVIMLGVNDAIGFGEAVPTPGRLFSDNLESLAEMVSEFGNSEIILVKPSPLIEWDRGTQRRLIQYASEIDLLCSLPIGITCGPDLLGLLGPDDFSDSVHPNSVGHDRIAWALADSIISVPEPSSALLLAIGLIALAVHPPSPFSGSWSDTH